MVYVKRKEHESTASLLRRFSRRAQQAGILLRARSVRFYKPRLTKRAQRARTLKRLETLRMREQLAKLGKLKEESK